MDRKELIDALSRLPEKDANSIIAEARANDRQQRMERGAAAIRAYLGHTPATDTEPEE